MFDKDLDKSLWYILEADAEKRNEIIEFLKRVPNELIEEIRDLLTRPKYEEDYYFDGNAIAQDGTIYSYIIEGNEEEKSLEIKQSLLTSIDTPCLNFSAELILANEDLSYETENYEEIWVGTFTSSMDIIGNVDMNSPLIKRNFIPFIEFHEGNVDKTGHTQALEFEYNLIKEVSGHAIKRTNYLYRKHDYIPLDINQMPNELNMDYITKRYSEKQKTKKLTPPKEN